jgi:hypothetical protein
VLGYSGRVPALSIIASFTGRTELEQIYNPRPIIVTTELGVKESVRFGGVWRAAFKSGRPKLCIVGTTCVFLVLVTNTVLLSG